MPSRDQIREVLKGEQTVERLAAIEHERWAHWQRYVHEQCESQEDGSLVIPAELAERWETQIETPYAELSEQEKDSDREQVHRYLSTIIDMLTR
ncbi:hypothetical protein DKT69_12805 [Micromonospora sicca]|uniref:Uncharacterized protein n=1 Tax=Micromonospora sicca TaxID=2202420 RepID=A0A317DQJ7_9ACTN|nr:hypothetical protein [Micromonospora sp. 4G51]PWR15093.1 hypothetical protein DKT69_12805 [Micromonospora sp. 4G51]